MSFTPPQPGIPSSFLAAVAACTFDATANALRDASGTLRYPVVAQASAGGALVEWGVDGAASPCPRALLTQQTYEILTLGALQTDGSIFFRGSHYRMNAAGTSGGGVLCSAVPA